MASHQLEAAEACLRMAENASDPHKRRLLLDLATKWLLKTPRNAESARVLAEVEALKHPT
jgi:hypothetical protein